MCINILHTRFNAAELLPWDGTCINEHHIDNTDTTFIYLNRKMKTIGTFHNGTNNID